MTVSETNINSNLEAHYSNDMKVKRPVINQADAPSNIPKHKLFSKKEADEKISKINSDIYVKTKKEKKKHEFNTSLFLTIFGAVAGITAIIAYSDRIKKFFKK